MRIKCRIWWPRHLSSSESSVSLFSNCLLFGWFLSSSSTSLDIVVAFAFDGDCLSHYGESALEEAIHHARQGMPLELQDKYVFSIVGSYVQNIATTKAPLVDGSERRPCIHNKECLQNRQNINAESCRQLGCGCQEHDQLQKQYRQPLPQDTSWIQLVYDSCRYSSKEICCIPEFHHMHWNGKMVSQCDLHVVVYETPTFGGHHLSLNICSSKNQKSCSKRPNWLDELHQKHLNLDLDAVIMAVNSAAAAHMLFQANLGLKRPCRRFLIVYMFSKFFWQLLAGVIASFSTVLYIALQFFHRFTRYGSKVWMYSALTKVFSNTCKNIQIRCCQFLYWPIFLKETDLRSQSCVEYAEKAAVKRNSVWASVAVDIILGNLVGFVLLSNAECVCRLVSDLASHITDDVLRSGCVWLMGVPAGFKLNTELAGVLGMISLNAIQIWSTLWSSVEHIFYYVFKLAALSGIFLGMTIPAALVMDMISIVALHVSTLRLLFSVLYSHQIQAFTALWRLFRGWKWNPLRHRLDSYDYTVEQHIVGSLLFTPLLLLLPTTSVFYIFFTIMNTTVIFLLLLVEVTISLIHATPYNKICLWLVRSKRFPSGIWLEIIRCQNASITKSDFGFLNQFGPTLENMQQDAEVNADKMVLISFLHSNILTFGQVVLPHYRSICLGVHRSTIASSFYGVFTGKRIPTKMGFGLPSAMPWMVIPYKEYWFICYDSVVSNMLSRQ
ncbi:hypothetical protein Ancab_013869 [Ancistrocladus abbreviatus]